MREIGRVTESNWIWPWAYRLHFSCSGSRTARLRPLLNRCAAGESKFDTTVEPRARWHARLGSDFPSLQCRVRSSDCLLLQRVDLSVSPSKVHPHHESPERWYVSASATILSDKVQQDLERSPIAPMIRKMHARLPGLYSRDKDRVLDAFRLTTPMLRYVSAVPPADFSAGDGWEPLLWQFPRRGLSKHGVSTRQRGKRSSRTSGKKLLSRADP